MPMLRSPLAHHWLLDPGVLYLNHGSYGACPRPVLEAQSRLREELERQPARFMRGLGARLDEVRREVAALVGGSPEGLAFVGNATTAVNAVLGSVALSPGDELLTTSHVYNACGNALEYNGVRAGAKVVRAPLPFPIASEDEVVEAVLGRVTPKTRLALLDHVTSPTGLVLPIERLVRELAARGVETLVDGAHAPGMLALDLDALGAAYYTGNFHKWLCAPKASAFLYVREDLRENVRPTVISHGANAPLQGRSRYELEFDWTGTWDPTALLAVPAAIRFLSSLWPGGLEELQRHNHDLALRARGVLMKALAVSEPALASMIGSLAAVPLPDSRERPAVNDGHDPIQAVLYERHHMEVPVMLFPAWPRRLVRISAQAYNTIAEYERLAEALVEAL